jgi:uncharacterized protein with PIN domain
MKCPKCGRELTLMTKAAAKGVMKPGEAVNMEEGVTTYTCQNKECEYYKQKLVWDNSKNNWKKLPK